MHGGRQRFGTIPLQTCVQTSPSPLICASFTPCSTHKEGSCTLNCKVLWSLCVLPLLGRTAMLKVTELSKTNIIGWGSMEMGWEGTYYARDRQCSFYFVIRIYKKAPAFSPRHLWYKLHNININMKKMTMKNGQQMKKMTAAVLHPKARK